MKQLYLYFYGFCFCNFEDNRNRKSRKRLEDAINYNQKHGQVGAVPADEPIECSTRENATVCDGLLDACISVGSIEGAPQNEDKNVEGIDRFEAVAAAEAVYGIKTEPEEERDCEELAGEIRTAISVASDDAVEGTPPGEDKVDEELISSVEAIVPAGPIEQHEEAEIAEEIGIAEAVAAVEANPGTPKQGDKKEQGNGIDLVQGVPSVEEIVKVVPLPPPMEAIKEIVVQEDTTDEEDGLAAVPLFALAAIAAGPSKHYKPKPRRRFFHQSARGDEHKMGKHFLYILQ